MNGNGNCTESIIVLKLMLEDRMGKPKYYYWDSRRQLYHIMKKKQGKIISYGYYPSEESAQFVVNELAKHNWDKLYLASIQKKLLERSI